MTKTERQLMREANAGEWNAWLGNDAVEECHLQRTDGNELQSIVSRVNRNGTQDCAPRDISIPPHQCASRCTNSVSCGTTPTTLILFFQRLSCEFPGCAHGGTSGDGGVSGYGS